MKLSWSLLLVLLVANIASFLWFLKGFFPSKPVLPGLNDQLIYDKSVSSPKFSKIVLMVVDALRSDFLYSEKHSNFHYVHQLITDNKAVPFTAFSNPPTVTLPRLKGITLGTTPNFLDAILNIADDKDSSQGLLNQDNWLYQFKNMDPSKPKILNFYGDDTWLKLFPDFFNNSDGTNSFFVNDFYDVDNNVTRHLEHELSKSAGWDGLFLHYLGLDHIGHKTGPRSNFMTSKHKELDGIIKRIYEFIDSSKAHRDDTLFVLMGDHGMNEIGNHGGSSKGETSAAMVFISPKFTELDLSLKAPLPDNEDFLYYTHINQIDMIPTLSLLFNFPIPKNSIGVIISEFLNMFKSKFHSQLLVQNCLQFVNLLQLDEAILNELAESKNVTKIYDFLLKTQETLVESASNYNFPNLHQAIAGSIICSMLVLVYFNYFIKDLEYAKNILSYQLVMVVYSFHFHGSSLIEEEHHLWWLFSVLFLLYLYTFVGFKQPYRFAIILSGLRLIKGWCNTGQKFNNYYVISNYMFENPSILWSLTILAYMTIGIFIYLQGTLRHCLNLEVDSNSFNPSYFANETNNIFTFIPMSMVVSISFTFKLIQAYLDGYEMPSFLENYVGYCLSSFEILDFDKKAISKVLINFSNYGLYGILVLLGLRVFFRFTRGFKIGTLTDSINLITLFIMNQTKAELIPIYLVFFIIRFQLARIIIDNKSSLGFRVDHLTIVLTIFNLLISNLTFFSMGGTNSLATVDLSNSYNGVESYEIEKVSLLTFISNFTGPIFWSLSTLNILLEPNVLIFQIKSANSDLIHSIGLKYQLLNLKLLTSLVFYSISCANLLISCFNLKFHLFIWTVFLPKLLYFGVWFVLINLLIDLLLSVVLITVS